MMRSRSLWTQGFRFSFTPLPGSFSPFLHSTVLYRSLGSIQPCGVVPACSAGVSRVPAYSGSRGAAQPSGYGAFTLSGRLSQSRSPLLRQSPDAVRTLQRTRCSLGSSGFARRYSRNRCFFLFLRLLRCFSSPGSPPCTMYSCTDARVFPARVSPFRHLRINGHVLLPAAFRSLSRLSSAPSAKASALRPFCLASPASRAVASARSAFVYTDTISCCMHPCCAALTLKHLLPADN